MEFTDYMLKLFIDMSETNIHTLAEKYYMEFTALLKLLTDTELGELRRKILNYKRCF